METPSGESSLTRRQSCEVGRTSTLTRSVTAPAAALEKASGPTIGDENEKSSSKHSSESSLSDLRLTPEHLTEHVQMNPMALLRRGRQYIGGSGVLAASWIVGG